MDFNLADGRPWLLLPGTLCTGAVFDPFLDYLGVSKSARHVMEMRHPRIEDYLEELKSLCHPGSVVSGFSLGAIVAAHLADRLPALNFILFGLNPHPDLPENRKARLSFAREVHHLGGAAALTPLLPELYGPKPAHVRETILQMAEETAGFIDAQTELALDRTGALGPLAKSKTPITLLTGTRDIMTPLALAEEAQKVIANGRVCPLDGLGHYALLEDPEACCRAVKIMDEV